MNSAARDSLRTGRPAQFSFTFHEIRRRPMLGDRLKVCWVSAGTDPPSVTIASIGTFGRRQFKRLASVPGIEFPPPGLEIDDLRLEPADALRVLRDRPTLSLDAVNGRTLVAKVDRDEGVENPLPGSGV